MMPRQGAAGLVRRGGDFGQRHRREFPGIGACGHGGTVKPFDRVIVDAPQAGGAVAHLFDGVAGGVDCRQTDGKGHPAAIGDVIMAERGGVGNDGADLVVADAKFFRI